LVKTKIQPEREPERERELERERIMSIEQIYLSRRNLLTLLSRLDRVRDGETSACTIIKNDDIHAKYPQTMKSIYVTAIENEDYYNDRFPGPVHPKDEPPRAPRGDKPEEHI
jgi:hypothetical protein